jgi:hypothetical protein
MFIAHEDPDKSNVCRTMFYDIACALSQQGRKAVFFSGCATKIRESKGNLTNYIFLKRTHGSFSARDLLQMVLRIGLVFKLMLRSKNVVVRSYPSMIIYGWMAFVLRKDVFFDTRGLFFDELLESGKLNPKFGKIAFALEKYLLRISTAVICVSDAQAREYKRRMGRIASEKYLVVHNGSSNSKKVDLESDKKALSIGYVGSLSAWHSPMLMRSVVQELAKVRPLDLFIFTPDISRAEELFSGLGINVTIEKREFRKDPVRFSYGLCLITGGISKTICFPVKAVEYLQAGCRLVGSDNVVVLREIVETTGAGVLVSLSDNGQMIAQKILSDFELNFGSEIIVPIEYSFEYQVQRFKEILN